MMPPRPNRLRAFTLVELVVSIATLSVLMAGLAAAILLSTHALPDAESPLSAVVDGADVAGQLAEELGTAVWIIEHTTTAITFTVPDRDNDGVPERIRYEWLGTPGDPLTRWYNDGTAVNVLESVNQFDLSYGMKVTTEEYPGPPVESARQQLMGCDTGLLTGLGTVKKNMWWGEYFKPALPAEALSWSVQDAYLRLRQKGGNQGSVSVALRPPTVQLLPDTTVLEEVIIPESELPLEASSFTWVQIPFSSVSNLSPDEGLCLVARSFDNKAAAEIEYYAAGISLPDAGLLQSMAQEAGWYIAADQALRFKIYGTYMYPGPTQTATRSYVASVGISLQAGDDPASKVFITARTLNLPELLSGMWETDFDDDPTLDHNGDGDPDWALRDGGTFDPAGLVGGRWQLDASLVTSPANDFTTLTTAEVSFRNTNLGGQGAVFWINAHWLASQCASIVAYLQLQIDGTQTLTVCHLQDELTIEPLVTVRGLPSGLVDLRLLIDPALGTVNIQVDEQDQGTYVYSRYTSSHNDRFASLLATGSAAEFDYVSIRVAE
jgi:hypothetical protein